MKKKQTHQKDYAPGDESDTSYATRRPTAAADKHFLEPYQLLANAVVQQACEDIIEYWTLPESSARFLSCERDKSTAETFLKSKNLILYTKVDGDYLLKKSFEAAIDKFAAARNRNARIEAEKDPKKRKRMGKPSDMAGWRIVERLNREALKKYERTGDDVEIYCDNCGKEYSYKELQYRKKMKIPYRFTGAKFLCTECCRSVLNTTTLDVILDQIGGLTKTTASLRAYLDKLDDQIDGVITFVDDLKAPAEPFTGAAIPPNIGAIKSDSLRINEEGGAQTAHESGADEKHPPDQH